MSRYSSFSDDFYINLNLNTEMDLPSNRETVLHHFEQIQKRFPSMRNFYTREPGEYVLEEEKERGRYRWATVEARRVCSGYVNPDSVDDALEQHRIILDAVPFSLSVSPLDCESLNIMFGFDFTYRGNHNQLIAEALGVSPAFDRVADIPGSTLISCDPSIQIALDEECRIQCRMSVEGRTTAYHARTGEFPEEQLSVYVTARRFGSLEANESYSDAMDRLAVICREMIDDYIIDNVLDPLKSTIALK